MDDDRPDIVWLIRHGPTDTPPKCCLGWSDVEVSDLEATERRLDRYAARLANVDRIFSSDLLRARQTAHLLRDRLDLEPHETELLREMHFGDWELSTFPEVEENDPENYWRFMDDWTTEPTPGGESFADLVERIETFWSAPPAPGGSEWAIVAHRGTCSAFAGFLLDWEPAESFRRGLDHAAACRVDVTNQIFEWNIGTAD